MLLMLSLNYNGVLNILKSVYLFLMHHRMDLITNVILFQMDVQLESSDKWLKNIAHSIQFVLNNLLVRCQHFYINFESGFVFL